MTEPRVSRRGAALTVVVGLLPVGVLVGALWAWIAPPVKGVRGADPQR